MKKAFVCGLAAVLAAMSACPGGGDREMNQPGTYYKDISRITLYSSNLPERYAYTNYRAAAEAYHRLVFDFNAPKERGFVWEDARYGGYGIAAYVGDGRHGRDGGEEAVAVMAAVLSACLTGTGQEDGRNYVRALNAFFSEDEKVILNNPGGRSASMSMWYLLYPALLYTQISFLNEAEQETRENVLTLIESWYRAYEVIVNTEQSDFEWTGFDFTAMRPYRNGVWKEPDAAAGMALLFYAGYRLTQNQTYLRAVFHLMDYLESYFGGPLYEVLMYFAPALAAELNVLYGKQYNVTKAVNRVFDGNSIPRGGWGSITGKWGSYEVNGLFGSKTDGGGYAFSMNTFAAAGAVAPLARYDTRYARDIGKWLLHLHSNARYFFPDKTGREHQSLYHDKSGAPDYLRPFLPDLVCIPFEGIRNQYNGKSPWFGGDPTAHGWAQTDLSLYSGAHTGILGALFEPTDVEGILKVNLLSTPVIPQDAYPSYLLYNPYQNAIPVRYCLPGNNTADLFDAVTNTAAVRSVKGETSIMIPGGGAVVIVEIPEGKTPQREGAHYFVDGRYVSSCRSTVSFAGWKNNQSVSGKIELKAVLESNFGDTIDHCTLTIDGQSFPMKDALVIRTKDFEPGPKQIHLEAVSTGGLTDSVDLRLLFE
jgi:hypothetical protein